MNALTPRDLPALSALYSACRFASWKQADIARALETDVLLGCKEKETLAGFAHARVTAGEAELLNIGVAPEARGRGTGARLLDALHAALRRAGAEAVFLEVSEHNAPARALYAAAGYTQVGRRARYYPDGQDALILRRAL